MRPTLFSCVVVCIGVLCVPAGAQTKAQKQRPLIIDMHLHAVAADAAGPPPVALCVPILAQLPDGDPRKPWKEKMEAMLKNPPCPNPVWSPSSDEDLIKQTIAVMERHNMIGALSGSPERVRQWRAAAPDRFIPALRFQIGEQSSEVKREQTGVAAPISVESFRELVKSGEIAILGEVLNQYAGIGPD